MFLYPINYNLNEVVTKAINKSYYRLKPLFMGPINNNPILNSRNIFLQNTFHVKTTIQEARTTELLITSTIAEEEVHYNYI